MGSYTKIGQKFIAKHYYVGVMTFGILLGCTFTYGSPILLSWWQSGTHQQTDFLSPIVSGLVRSNPIRIVIPAINLDTTFVTPLGLNPDQTISVPDSYTKVGWYKNGATPGEIGSAVILGHVDSISGPAVFYSLGQLKANDEIAITREDGSDVRFLVTEIKRYSQDEFPTEAVYGQFSQPVLRLVTCTGDFNRQEQRYSHNLVVYATVVTEP
jgi:hypothetical protein